ncbi:MAG: hypothetical protein QM752_06730 [Gammaproteobacteria bacterium]
MAVLAQETDLDKKRSSESSVSPDRLKDPVALIRATLMSEFKKDAKETLKDEDFELSLQSTLKFNDPVFKGFLYASAPLAAGGGVALYYCFDLMTSNFELSAISGILGVAALAIAFGTWYTAHKRSHTEAQANQPTITTLDKEVEFIQNELLRTLQQEGTHAAAARFTRLVQGYGLEPNKQADLQRQIFLSLTQEDAHQKEISSLLAVLSRIEGDSFTKTLFGEDQKNQKLAFDIQRDYLHSDLPGSRLERIKCLQEYDDKRCQRLFEGLEPKHAMQLISKHPEIAQKLPISVWAETTHYMQCCNERENRNIYDVDSLLAPLKQDKQLFGKYQLALEDVHKKYLEADHPDAQRARLRELQTQPKEICDLSLRDISAEQAAYLILHDSKNSAEKLPMIALKKGVDYLEQHDFENRADTTIVSFKDLVRRENGRAIEWETTPVEKTQPLEEKESSSAIAQSFNLLKVCTPEKGREWFNHLSQSAAANLILHATHAKQSAILLKLPLSKLVAGVLLIEKQPDTNKKSIDALMQTIQAAGLYTAFAQEYQAKKRPAGALFLYKPSASIESVLDSKAISESGVPRSPSH